ncbi:MAG: regulatory protein GemA [Pseudomonadota bacterium]
MANKRKALTPSPSPKPGRGGQEVPKAERSRLIKVIHTAQRELKLGEADYRATLEGVTGKRSCSDMDAAELMKVVERMRELGFKPKGGKTRKGKLSPKTRGTAASEDQRSKIRALWIECYNLGVVKNRYEQGLNKFVRRMTAVDQVDWLVRAEDCNKVIEALKAMKKRGEDDAGGEA